MSKIRTTIAAVRMTAAIVRLSYRFISGRPLNGQRKTDSTFRRPGTRSLDPSGTALRWEMLPGYQRLLYRLGGCYLLFLLSILLMLSGIGRILALPTVLSPTFILLAHLAAGSTVGVGYALRRYVRDYGYTLRIPVRIDAEGGVRRTEMRALWEVEGRKAWEAEKVLPVAGAVSQILGVSAVLRTEKLRMIHIPRGYHDGAAIVITLPAHFAGVGEKVNANLERVIAQKLGARELRSAMMLEGSAPQILLRVPPAPPTHVTFSSVRKQLEGAEEFRPMLGITRGEEALYAEMISDSPHIGISAGPGAGKSSEAKLIIMQVLHWGWGVVICDWKMTKEFSWVRGLTGVTYVSEIEDLHDLGERLSEEIDIRKRAGMRGRANVLVVRDEWNITAPLLYDYYSALRSTAEPEERKAMPLRSPALSGYAMLDFAGREYGLFDLCIAQRFTARIFNGNADIRECFGIKLLARYSPQTSKMLVGTMKLPRKSNTPGRWTVVAGDEATVVQGVLVTNEEAREFAASGQENPLTPFSSSYRVAGGSGERALSTQDGSATPGVTGGSREALPVLEGEAVEIRPRLLSEMLDELTDVDESLTLKILRKAAGDPDNSGFPAMSGVGRNGGYLYDSEAVRMWTRKRHAAKVTQTK